MPLTGDDHFDGRCSTDPMMGDRQTRNHHDAHHDLHVARLTVATVTGSPVYVRLRFQLDALSSAQESVTTMATAQEESRRETNSPAVSMSSLFTGMEQAHDDLLCAVSIVDRYKPTDKDDENAKDLLIIALTRKRRHLQISKLT